MFHSQRHYVDQEEVNQSPPDMPILLKSKVTDSGELAPKDDTVDFRCGVKKISSFSSLSKRFIIRVGLPSSTLSSSQYFGSGKEGVHV
mmetsp:Transcript_52993/g.78567  ORF Transcript_52993/g.78567 Transcript_52993/m.78567 type:complete len:88 (-) Transcript_52993:401-664(-)